MFLRIEETPNPNTIKFIPEEKLRYAGTKLYSASDNLEDSLLLKTIFSVKGVTTVLINSDFIYQSQKRIRRLGRVKNNTISKNRLSLMKKIKFLKKKRRKILIMLKLL